MRKSSLGRRNSNRPSSAFGRPSADVSSVRKSGIPVARSKSTERPSTMGNISRMNHAVSTSNLHFMDMMTPGKTPKTPLSSRFISGPGTERPSRATGTSSIGTSSYGGGKTKRDNRPLQDKEWQTQAYHFIENLINSHPNGADVLGPGLKPLSINKFVDACDFLLKLLDGSVSINKANYIKELPFLLGKKMFYKGKMEKSWMIAVNTQHAIPYALGLLHFLASCAHIMMNGDVNSLMFPCPLENNQFLNEMNFQILIPYYNDSYELRKSTPNYQEYQEELDQLVMKRHYDQDDVLSKRDRILGELDSLQERYQKMERECELAQAEYEILEQEYKKSSENIKNKEEDLINGRITMTQYESESSEIDRTLNSIDGELEMLKEEHAKLLKTASEQGLSHRDIEHVKKRRDSLEREITSNEKYILSYQEMIFAEDMNIVKYKTQIEELTRQNNVRAMKYFPIEQRFDKFNLPTKIEEIDLASIELQKQEIEKMKAEFVARAENFQSEKSIAESDLEKSKKNLIELEASCTSERVKINSLKMEIDSEQEMLEKEQLLLDEELKKMNSELAGLQEEYQHLQTECDLKTKLVTQTRKDNEEARKMYANTVEKMKEMTVDTIRKIQQKKEVKKRSEETRKKKHR